jgi:hypothetical protein
VTTQRDARRVEFHRGAITGHALTVEAPEVAQDVLRVGIDRDDRERERDASTHGRTGRRKSLKNDRRSVLNLAARDDVNPPRDAAGGVLLRDLCAHHVRAERDVLRRKLQLFAFAHPFVGIEPPAHPNFIESVLRPQTKRESDGLALGHNDIARWNQLLDVEK